MSACVGIKRRFAMRAVQIDNYGGPEVLRFREIATPLPGPGEIRIRLAASGINFMDIHTRTGKYATSANYTTTLPLTLGIEGAGTVDMVGRGVNDWREGDRAAYCIVRGSYADYAVVPVTRAVPVPDGLSDRLAAASLFQGLTAHYLAHDVGQLAKGKTCIVHAGSGGIAQLLIQLAKRAGARVLATASSAVKEQVARRAGADRTCTYDIETFGAAARDMTDGLGVDVVFDSVGPATLDGSIAALRRCGLLVLFGSNSGPTPHVRPMQLADAGSLYFTRPRLAHYIADVATLRRRADDIFASLLSGALRLDIERVYAFENVAEAHAALEERRSIGKSVLGISASA